jgi:nucleotide-binding universal stress UspA family protein
MNKLFNNILVSVDFSKESEEAIGKAIEMANRFQCNIHLLYVEGKGLISKSRKKIISWGAESSIDTSETRLYALQNKYTYQLNPGLLIQASLRTGSLESSIVEYTIKNQIDLIIVGKAPFYSRIRLARALNITRLSKKVNCPVLTIRSGSKKQKWSNIVLPVNADLPIRKIMFASYLAKKFNSRIHLIAVKKRGVSQPDATVYLYKAYQLLRDNTNLRIECHTVQGESLAEGTLQYAQKIDAGLIVVDPGKESALSGFVDRFFAGFFFNNSGIPVMTVSSMPV